jgi:GDPmannose 4,6-dehydratase
MKTAIITGITGQDGPYLAKFLLERNYKVIGSLRSYRNFNEDPFTYLGLKDKLIFEKIDLLDLSNVIDAIRKFEPQEIYNLAAQSSVSLSFKQPIGTFFFNTMSVNHLLEGIRLTGIPVKYYQASSSEMFGKVANLPITLETPINPLSPYAVSKAAAHSMCQTYRSAYQIFACNGILFNHESYLRSENFFVKKIIVEAIRIKRGLQTVLTVGNLDIKRDFGYAPRYVEAMWKMLQAKHPDDYIICSGKSVLLRDIVEHVFEHLSLDKKKIVVNPALFRPNEPYELFGDCKKARECLDWHYDVSFFEVLDSIIEEELLACKRSGL